MRISDWSSDVCSSDLDSKGSSILKSGYLTLIYHLSGAAASLRSEPRKRRYPAREAEKTTIRQPKHVARSIVPTFMSFSDVFRSVESRVGNECVITCSSWCLPDTKKKK